MKKLLTVLFVVCMMLNLVACGSNEKENTEPVNPDTQENAWVWDGPKYDEVKETLGAATIDLTAADGKLASILEKGVLVVATSPDYPPSEYVDVNTGDIKGSDMLLAQYIANSLGVTLQIEAMDFSAVLTAVSTDKADLGISGFGYKEDRAEQYELSHGYQSGTAASHHTLMIKKEDLDKFNSLEDFNVEGLKIDAQANSLQHMYVEDQLTNATLTLVSSIDQEILELQSGKVDAVAMDATTAKNYAEQSNGMFVSVWEEKGIEFDLTMYDQTAGNVVAAKKGEVSLINAVNEIIDQMMEAGLYSTMYYAACDDAGVAPGDDE
ncbi:MAG: transporter substrate-binding domain-containing protein [Erysipelotrichaceae bacterium]|nr:transporter substrate-binding domain-containing protein [Erysipelotrichaceae bacterium]